MCHYTSATTSHWVFFSLCRLCHCSIGEDGCSAVALALRSNSSHLRELNLSLNKPGNSVKLLCDLLEEANCKLESLKWGVIVCGVCFDIWTTCNNYVIIMSFTFYVHLFFLFLDFRLHLLDLFDTVLQSSRCPGLYCLKEIIN